MYAQPIIGLQAGAGRAGVSESDDILRAQALFRRFHGRGAKPGEIIALAAPAKNLVVLEVGTLLSIGYRAVGNGESFFHEFEAPRAKLFVSSGGTQACIVGGAYRFTERGFLK